MTYTPQTWVDNTTPLDATHMNFMEAGIGASVAADSVVVAASRIVANKLLTADTQPAFRVFGSGKIEWGPGGSTAPDTNLYRSATDTLATDDTLQVGVNVLLTGASGAFVARSKSGAVAAFSSTGDTVDRLWIASDGTLTWGPGNAAPDTTLYRAGAGALKTDSSLTVIGSPPANWSALSLNIGGIGVRQVVTMGTNSAGPGYMQLAVAN